MAYNCSFTVCTSDNDLFCAAAPESGVPTLYVALPLITVFFLIMAVSGGILCCLPLQRFFDNRLVGMLIILAAVCMWLFWLVNFLSQLNPIRAPVLNTLVAGHIRKEWPQSHSDLQLCQTW
jgi:V-type H+-transporting ATPase subunit e